MKHSPLFRRGSRLLSIISLSLILSGCTLADLLPAGKTPISLDPADIVLTINKVISVLSAAFGIVTVAIMIAGYQMLMAAGDNEGQTRAKETIKYAAIGLLIVVFAYAIVKLIFSVLAQNITGAGAI